MSCYKRNRCIGILPLILALNIFFLINCRRDNPDNEFISWFALDAIYTNSICQAKLQKVQTSRVFQTGFETQNDFSGFYSVPQNYQNAASHELQGVTFFNGASSHRGWIYGSGPACPSWQNCNHRAYPTIQLYKTSQGSFRTPVMIEFQANLNMPLAAGQWFSFATLSADASDNWNRVVLVNLGRINNGTRNYLHLMHVPLQGQNTWTYQTSDLNNSLPYTESQWTKISVCIDLHPDTGFAKVWQNNTLVSSAQVRGGCGLLEQAHFGLYAPPGINSGTIYNDDLTIREISQCP